MKPIVKIIFSNIFIIIVGVIFIDLLLGNWITYTKNMIFEKDPVSRFSDRYYETVFTMCPDKYLHHVYCPEISHRQTMRTVDGGETIVSYVNKSSLRVATPHEVSTTTDVTNYEVINIGDSMLQADEVFYEDTLSRALETVTGKKALQVGMGSWAPINFYSWLKSNSLKRGVEVNIFVHLNDIIPSYYLSNINYYGMGYINNSGRLQFEDYSFIWELFGESNFSGKLKHALVMNSVVYRFLLKIKNKLNEKKAKENTSSPRIFSDVLSEPVTDCSRWEEYDDVTTSTRGYVELAFVKECWDEKLFRSIDSGIADLKKSIEIVHKVEGKVRIFIVPAPWAFKDEGFLSKTHDAFKMTENAVITAEPLVEYITMKMKDQQVEVISLEKVIKNLKKHTQEKLYFPYNPHWNKNGQQILGRWMAETFYQ
jgi:hypothetical protein